ncbi:hypothetical protein [Nonomuraea soli]|uniref:SH3 domain-containing protein n=1 Tax=Nonomuraea soli TaxID=1032476 RepID=A0A7W0CKJ1_9ACTN|nr:hypothetical protein [Nonomuraea soli]MBA2892652.1 hypothetical protein [Nonomuraea soli]
MAGALLVTAAPASASAGAITFTCRYDANVRSSPYTGRPNVIDICYTGTRINPRCWVRGGWSNGDNRWYRLYLGQQTREQAFIHFSQVSTSGSGGIGAC